MADNFARKVLLIIGLSIMGLLINIDYTAVNLALVTISNEMHSSLDVMQWILSGYVLAWAAIVIPAGKWADVFSQRRICAFGLALFMVSSVFAGLSTSAWMIIASRVVQGISGAIFVPTLYSLIYSNFSSEQRGTAIGFFSLGVGVGAAIGPSFGGFLLETLGWSWIFYINVPLTSLAMACILIGTPKDSAEKKDKQALQSNSCILGLGIVVLMYTINLLNNNALFSPKILSLLCCFVVLSLVFVLIEKRAKNPAIPRSLMLNKKYRGITAAFALEQFCFSSSYVALGLYMQNVLLYSAYYSSIIFLALSCIFALIATFSGFIVDRMGINRPALLGFALLAMGSYCFLLLPVHVNTTQLVIVLLLLGAGMGFAFSALNTGMMSTVKEQEIGIASSVFVMLALVGNALGVVITTLIILSQGINTAFNLTAIISLLGAAVIIKMMRFNPALETLTPIDK
jgi:EmrB/QacA subfamily drug resistance transporter